MSAELKKNWLHFIQEGGRVWGQLNLHQKINLTMVVHAGVGRCHLKPFTWPLNYSRAHWDSCSIKQKVIFFSSFLLFFWVQEMSCLLFGMWDTIINHFWKVFFIGVLMTLSFLSLFSGPVGAKGERGDRGDRGEKGDRGPIGPKGESGSGSSSRGGARGEKVWTLFNILFW